MGREQPTATLTSPLRPTQMTSRLGETRRKAHPFQKTALSILVKTFPLAMYVAIPQKQKDQAQVAPESNDVAMISLSSALCFTGRSQAACYLIVLVPHNCTTPTPMCVGVLLVTPTHGRKDVQNLETYMSTKQAANYQQMKETKRFQQASWGAKTRVSVATPPCHPPP